LPRRTRCAAGRSRARYEAELARQRYMSVDPANRLVADVLEAEWNQKLRMHAAVHEDYERHTQQQRRRADAETQQRILSLASDFPSIWNDPELPARERKRVLRLLIEDVTLLKTEKITAHVRLRGGATRTLVLDRPVPIAQIRKCKPEMIAEIDALLNEHCDRQVAEILNQRGCRTWQNTPFTLKKIAWIRMTYHLKSRFGRLREQGLLTGEEIAKVLGISETTVHEWARCGLLRRIVCDSRGHSLYEPLRDVTNYEGAWRPWRRPAGHDRCRTWTTCNMKRKFCPGRAGDGLEEYPHHNESPGHYRCGSTPARSSTAWSRHSSSCPAR
jgi:hypothetical protein